MDPDAVAHLLDRAVVAPPSPDSGGPTPPVSPAPSISFRTRAHAKQYETDNPAETVREQPQASIELDERSNKRIRRQRRRRGTIAVQHQPEPNSAAESTNPTFAANNGESTNQYLKYEQKQRRRQKRQKKRRATVAYDEGTLTSTASISSVVDQEVFKIAADEIDEPFAMPARAATQQRDRSLFNNIGKNVPGLLQPLDNITSKLSAAAASFIRRLPSATPSKTTSTSVGGATLTSQFDFHDPLKLQDDLTKLALDEQVDDAEQLLRRLERNYGTTPALTSAMPEPLSDVEQFYSRAPDYTGVAADEASLRIRDLFTSAGVDSYQDLVVYVAKRIEQLDATSDRLAAEVGAVQGEVLSLRNLKSKLRDELELLTARRAHLFDEMVTKQKVDEKHQQQQDADKKIAEEVFHAEGAQATKTVRVLDVEKLQTAYRRQAVLLRKRRNFRSAHYAQSNALRHAEDLIDAQLARSMALEKAAANRMIAIGEQIKSQKRQMHSCRHDITLLRQEVNAYVLDFDEQDMESPTTAGDNNIDENDTKRPALDFDDIGRMLERQDMKTFFMLRTEPMKMLDTIGEDMNRNAELIAQCVEKSGDTSRKVVLQLDQLASLYRNFQDYLRRYNVVHIPEKIWLEYRRLERQPRATAHALQTAVHTYEALSYTIKCLVDCTQTSRDLVVDELARHAGDSHRFQYIKRMADSGAKIFDYQERLAAARGVDFNSSDVDADSDESFDRTSWDNEAVKLAELDSFYSTQHE